MNPPSGSQSGLSGSLQFPVSGTLTMSLPLSLFLCRLPVGPHELLKVAPAHRVSNGAGETSGVATAED